LLRTVRPSAANASTVSRGQLPVRSDLATTFPASKQCISPLTALCALCPAAALQKDVTPLIALMGGALTWMAYKGYEHLRAPDVFISPERRSRDAHDKYDEDEAVQFKRNTAKHYRHKEVRGRCTS